MQYVRSILRTILGMMFLLMSLTVHPTPQGNTETVQEYSRLHEQGILHLDSNNFPEALVTLDQALEQAIAAQNSIAQANIMLSISRLHFKIHNFDYAALQVLKAIEILNDEERSELMAQAKTLLGYIYSQNGKWEEAEIFLNQANQYYSDYGTEDSRASVLLGYGALSIKRKQFSQAINYLEAARTSLNNQQDIDLLAQCELLLAEAYLKIDPERLPNALNRARQALTKASELAKNQGLVSIEIESLRLESYVALRGNKFNDAEEFLMNYERKNDSLYQYYLSTITQTTTGNVDLASLNEIIDQQKSDLDRQQRSISFSKITTGLSIALIVILSLLTLSLYKNNNLRAKANILLKDKNTELQLSKEKAEKASMVKAEFLSTITHELRTPMYAVTGLTHLLLEENPKPEQKEHLRSLQFSGEYLLNLINNILDLNKLEANKVEIEKTTFNLKKRLNDVLITLNKSAVDRKNNLVLEFDDEIPKKLEGDSVKLSQILINLIGNSLKFTQNGDVIVRVKKLGEKKDKVMCLCRW